MNVYDPDYGQTLCDTLSAEQESLMRRIQVKGKLRLGTTAPEFALAKVIAWLRAYPAGTATLEAWLEAHQMACAAEEEVDELLWQLKIKTPAFKELRAQMDWEIGEMFVEAYLAQYAERQP